MASSFSARSAFTALTTLWVPSQFFSSSLVYPHVQAPMVCLFPLLLGKPIGGGSEMWKFLSSALRLRDTNDLVKRFQGWVGSEMGENLVEDESHIGLFVNYEQQAMQSAIDLLNSTPQK